MGFGFTLGFPGAGGLFESDVFLEFILSILKGRWNGWQKLDTVLKSARRFLDKVLARLVQAQYQLSLFSGEARNIAAQKVKCGYEAVSLWIRIDLISNNTIHKQKELTVKYKIYFFS